MNQALEEVKKTIKAKNGGYILETNPMIVGEGEKTLSEQLIEARERERLNEEDENNEEEEQEGINANLPTFDANEFEIRKSKK